MNILFKGKRLDNGEIVEGFYFEGFTGIPYILTLHDHILGMTQYYEVDPATVEIVTPLYKAAGAMYEALKSMVGISGNLDCYCDYIEFQGSQCPHCKIVMMAKDAMALAEGGE